ncbi:MAG: hypothetical protein JW874_12530 [Spirochaetales bacterium]|nr:hypothetical protein [Spirochaetales bacterium]
MDKKILSQFKAFLISHQTGNDPNGYIDKLSRIAMAKPEKWDGKLPSDRGFEPNLNLCKVSAATPERPVIPWWWYVNQNEPVPSVVEDIYENITFDYVLVYPASKIWIYIIVEPDRAELDILKKQDNLRAFIIMSIINKNFESKQRNVQRLRLGQMLKSKDINNILTFAMYTDDYKYKNEIPKNLPTIQHIVDSSGTNWKISVPGQKQYFLHFKDLLATFFSAKM